MRIEVLALVGPSGTGKSHKAALVAAEEGVQALIDDGLLIHEGKILAGTSAKAEPNKLAATRRAVFTQNGHAKEVQAALSSLNPSKVLVLGTSRRMVERICAALALPQITRIIRIEEIQTQDEMETARRLRKQGKHVVPVPTLEVKKRFSGFLVDPIRFFIKRREAPGMLVEKSVIQPTWSYLGRFTIADSAIRALVRIAAREIRGIHQVRRVEILPSAAGITIRVDLAVTAGARLPTLMQMVQRRVKDVVEHATALNVLGVHVTVVSLSDPKPATK